MTISDVCSKQDNYFHEDQHFFKFYTNHITYELNYMSWVLSRSAWLLWS